MKNICTAKSLSRVGKRCQGIQSRMIPMYHLSSFTSTLPHKNFLHSHENKRNKTFLRKMGIPGLFFYYFWSFQTNNTIFTTKQCEKCPNINLVKFIRRHTATAAPGHFFDRTYFRRDILLTDTFSTTK